MADTYDYHIDNLPGAPTRAKLNDNFTNIKNNKADKSDTDGAIQDLQTNKLEKTATAADSAKLGGLLPDGYARKVHSHTADDLPNGTTTAPGILQLLDSVTSTSTTYAATAKSAKTAYDKGQSAYTLAQSAKTTADAAYPKAGGDINGTINYTPDTGNVITLDNKTVLYRHTVAGAISFGADEAVVIGSGESRNLTAQNVDMLQEVLHLSSDNQMVLRTNLNGGWPGRKDFLFETDGGFKPANVAKTRTNLQVYGKSETYSQQEVVTEIENRLPITGYALLDFGLISINSRYILDNPFGNNTPALCFVEIQVNNKWFSPGYYTDDAGQYWTRLVKCGFVESEGIVIVTGNQSLNTGTSVVGELVSGMSVVTTAKCRAHIWRVGV